MTDRLKPSLRASVIESAYHLPKRRHKSLHLGFLADGDTHVVWECWEQSADVDVAFFQCLDQRDDRTFHVEHDEVGMRWNLFVAHVCKLAGRECFRFGVQTLACGDW